MKYAIILFLCGCTNTTWDPLYTKDAASIPSTECSTTAVQGKSYALCPGYEPVKISETTECLIVLQSYGADVVCGDSTVSIYNQSNSSCLISGTKLYCFGTVTEIINTTINLNLSLNCSVAKTTFGAQLLCGSIVINLYGGTFDGDDEERDLEFTGCKVKRIGNGYRVKCKDSEVNVDNDPTENVKCKIYDKGKKRKSHCEDHRPKKHVESCKEFIDRKKK